MKLGYFILPAPGLGSVCGDPHVTQAEARTLGERARRYASDLRGRAAARLVPVRGLIPQSRSSKYLDLGGFIEALLWLLRYHVQVILNILQLLFRSLWKF